MNQWRVSLTLLTVLLIGGPLFFPVSDLIVQPSAFAVWNEVDRLASLAAQTFLLAAGTVLVTLPLGTLLAILLYRTDLPGRQFWRFCLFLTLFIPLPLFVSAWQATLGTHGLYPLAVWNTIGMQTVPGVLPGGPWALGLPAAIWVHSLAGLPWVVLIVGQGLSWVERPLEEDASLAAPPWIVCWRVTLVRARAALAAAALWLVVMTCTEITITDMMQVRTFAEEIYTQIVVGDTATVARAAAVALPFAALLAGVILVLVRHWQRRVPALEDLEVAAPPVPLGKARWFWAAGLCVVVGLLLVVPIFSLFWKTGLTGSPPHWTGHIAWLHLRNAGIVRWRLVLESLAQAAASGLATSILALLLCWLAMEARWLQFVLLGFMALIWAWPAPLVGMGLKATIVKIIDLVPIYPVASMLYYGPSLAPVVWAHVIRFFPCALALLWPVVRLVPIQLREAARTEGAGPWSEFLLVIWPLTRAACLRAGLAVAILSLGELGAGKIAETPGGQNFAHEVFTQMHYGITNDLAALCLLLLGMVLPGAAFLWFQSTKFARGSSTASPDSALRATASVNSM